ncbi:LytTR family DNA-binding domain-containing protein [Mangrovivirga sp. M17]|uniref:LytTR family DNA-binding domain-containing protein n=1 Tax=Mangrovivirga halotolerans TaxID=2993936 RepID=A0ABT3RP17_9BACT|nr:LytTR family DNA-binding domain-containing protein [Mangrovivirga halotolerans]MCX2743283.1 LytTR family DNA-binding domain-containing protein [Mangrovivirga halotolerans]
MEVYEPKDLDIDFSLSVREKLIMVFLTGLYMYLFLIFFQPFGVNNYDPQERLSVELLLAVAFMIFISTLAFFLETTIIYNKLILKYKGKGFVFWIIISVLVISVSTFLAYNILGGWHDWVLSSFVEFIINMGALFLIPVAGIFIYIYQRSLNSTLKRAYSYPNPDVIGNQLITLQSDNEKDTLLVNLKDILMIESEDNYIGIHFLEKDNVRKILLRKTLKSIEGDSLSEVLIRCHRSYIINLMNLNQVFVNKNKMYVKINHLDSSIPVSRNHQSKIGSLVNR